MRGSCMHGDDSFPKLDHSCMHSQECVLETRITASSSSLSRPFMRHPHRQLQCAPPLAYTACQHSYPYHTPSKHILLFSTDNLIINITNERFSRFYPAVSVDQPQTSTPLTLLINTAQVPRASCGRDRTWCSRGPSPRAVYSNPCAR